MGDPRPPHRPIVPVYRRVFGYILFSSAVVVAALALTVDHPPARMNVATTAFALAAGGAIFRFGHLRF